jgi:hypothetical protein
MTLNSALSLFDILDLNEAGGDTRISNGKAIASDPFTPVTVQNG